MVKRDDKVIIQRILLTMHQGIDFGSSGDHKNPFWSDACIFQNALFPLLSNLSGMANHQGTPSGFHQGMNGTVGFSGSGWKV